jgi:hypothetical protein
LIQDEISENQDGDDFENYDWDVPDEGEPVETQKTIKVYKKNLV